MCARYFREREGKKFYQKKNITLGGFFLFVTDIVSTEVIYLNLAL
jgi:hypothetical protein